MSFRIEADLCPYCAQPVDAVTKVADPDRIPAPGALTICLYCAGACMFTEDMKLIKLTEKERRKLHPETQRHLRTAQSFARALLAKRKAK